MMRALLILSRNVVHTFYCLCLFGAVTHAYTIDHANKCNKTISEYIVVVFCQTQTLIQFHEVPTKLALFCKNKKKIDYRKYYSISHEKKGKSTFTGLKLKSHRLVLNFFLLFISATM